jgi:predicted secreted Zn-dependent protease
MQMRLACSGLAACALAAACALPSDVGRRPRIQMPPEANLQMRYYDVSGGTAGELMAALQQFGPGATDTGAFFAKTSWTVIWHGDWAPGPDGCAIVSSQTQLESQMAIPRWRTTAASADLAADWKNFVRNLEAHERGHVVNAVRASRAVDDGLRHLSLPACDGMEAAARARIDSIVASFRLVDEEYDARTRHGASQGAVWPPRATRNMQQPGPGEVFHNPPLRLPTTQP